MSKGSSSIAIISALVSNLAVATTKFIAASYTGSSAMISEGIHSLVDAANTLLLLIGSKRSQRAPSIKHPFGYGKEIYFWTLVVAISLFAIGGGMSIYEGIDHIAHPRSLQDPTWNYVVLGLSLIFTGISWVVAFREFSKTRKEKTVWTALRSSKDPGVFAILFEDTADVAGIVVAFIGVYVGHMLENPYIDGIAAIVIGTMLIITSFMLVYQSKRLLIGESADPELIQKVIDISKADPAVDMVKPPLTMHLGPNDILLALGINFNKELNSGEVAAAIDRIEKAIRDKYPEVKKIFIEAKSITYFKND
ncbi:MAG: cation diffusion facilitator family transporter [Cytophagaceae bacterium]|nr:cation diffusion facilitator family transporter [Cytophagaceae bacterium]